MTKRLSYESVASQCYLPYSPSRQNVPFLGFSFQCQNCAKIFSRILFFVCTLSFLWLILCQKLVFQLSALCILIYWNHLLGSLIQSNSTLNKPGLSSSSPYIKYIQFPTPTISLLTHICLFFFCHTNWCDNLLSILHYPTVFWGQGFT